jgi:large subunit ribosomal protein L23
MNTIIKKPLITEKASITAEKDGKFTFVVDRKANKLQIKSAVEKMYNNVHVVNINTATYGGGKSSTKYTNRGIVEQKRAIWKKAIVTLADGETIDLYNNL